MSNIADRDKLPSLVSARPLHQLSREQQAAFNQAIDTLLSPDQVIRDLTRRLALSTDASFYQLTPSLILHIEHAEQVRRVIALAHQYQVAITFRAAGTSLSGQAVTDSVLIMLSSHWQHADILEDGLKISLQPGIIGAHANRLLAPYGRKIGPDPASINACKIGGIAANNASGMCCGIQHNSYHTLAAMHLILADGGEVRTDDETSRQQFSASHSALLNELTQLSQQVKGDPQLVAHIRHQFRLKNTMGYGINALLDFDDPIDMLAHLMIGSEGTLGFIANITYHTIPIPKHRSTGLYLFSSLDEACRLPAQLKALNVNAVELMDTRALRAVEHLLSPFTTEPVADGEVALLVEMGADCDNTLASLRQAVQSVFNDAVSIRPICEFTREPSVIDTLWTIRKGLFPAVGSVRETGSTVIIEDVALPLEQLADALNELSQLFKVYHYPEAIIFGHALDGNLHFVFTQRFDTEDEKLRYKKMMAAVVELIAHKYDGTLKAEHGTGRNMAPFLSNQWGQQSVTLMREIKALLDPSGILNPGVILSDNPHTHLENLKTLPPVADKVDACIECGFCEPNCPSRNFTLTPRQRIALKRRANHLSTTEKQTADKEFQLLGVDSCASTGMCAVACPVDIDTGDWVRDLRNQTSKNDWFARFTTHHLALLIKAFRVTLNTAYHIGKLLSPARLEKISRTANKLSGRRIPVRLDTTPSGASGTNCHSAQFSEKVIYLASCPNRIFGANAHQASLSHVVTSLLNKAGIQVIIPRDSDTLCCGQPWHSKGYAELADEINSRTTQSINNLNHDKDFPVITDASSCALQFKQSGQPYWELSTFLLERVAPKLNITPLDETVLLHTTCATKRTLQPEVLKTLAQLCVARVIELDEISCCGFAGDKGFWLPELNESALTAIKNKKITACRRGISNNRSCEIGLSRHSGIQFSHIAYLLDEVSR